MEDRANEFVAEAREHLTGLEQVLLSLESPGEASVFRERLDRCLRIVHSLKGDAGFQGYTAIRTLADAMETLLERMRDGEAPLGVETLLAARDRLAALADDLKHSHQADLGDILAQLTAVAHSPAAAGQEWTIDLREVDRARGGRLAGFFQRFQQSGAVSEPRLELTPHDLAQGLFQGAMWYRARLQSSSPREAIRRDLGLPNDNIIALAIDLAEWSSARRRPLGRLLAELANFGDFERPRLEMGTADLAASLPKGPLVLRGALRTSLGKEEIGRRLGLPDRALPGASPAAVPADAPSAARPVEPRLTSPLSAAAAARSEAEKTSSLRVQVELLDRLMTLIGELTLVRNQSLLAFDEDGRPRAIVQRLNAVTSDLQATVLRTRMQPVGNLFGKFPRVVRDLGRQLGKQVEVTIVGGDVELDKTILEQLSDPLTHLVRNSVDHGIESPEQRIANNKPPSGRITLAASHDDGQVRIEIRDDGRGVNVDSVRAKALSLRLKTEDELARMSRRELMGLILLPGFSTAGQVTDVSGRGVGMDVVKNNLESLEGTLTIDSQPGVGTAMILRVPLTLAIIPCLIVVIDGDRYAIPQREVEEVVCLHPRLRGRIEQAFDTEVFRLRDRLLPIIRMREVLRRRRPFTAEAKAEILRADAESDPQPASAEYIVVVRQRDKLRGLLVDDVRGIEEVVVKPMHPMMKQVKIFSGATIMGDGRIALIVNVAGIVEHARVSFEGDAIASGATAARDPSQAHRLLLFEYGPQEQFALPLLQIRRVAAFDAGQIERVGAHEYVVVEGAATRIVRLDHSLGVSACETSSTMRLVLPKFSREPVGILISRIVDCESMAVVMQPIAEHAAGVLGTAILHGRLTLLLDMHYLLELRPDAPSSAAASAGGPSQPRVLLIDDTPFFREAVGRYLKGAGIAVIKAVDGEEGLRMLAEGPFDLIVSDIEMPVMDGWTLPRQARERGFGGPLLALSSLSKPENDARAKAAGFDYYEEKLNHDRLVRTVKQMLAGQPPA